MKIKLNRHEVEKWTKIILQISCLILGGMSKGKAVDITSKKFGINPKEIWKHVGF